MPALNWKKACAAISGRQATRHRRSLRRRLGTLFPALLSLSLVLGLSACSSIPFIGKEKDKKDFEQEDMNTTEQILYRNAQRSLRSGNYSVAIETLQRLEARFPFGRYAEQAQLEIIYAHFMATSFDAARTSADRFIRLHPSHPHIDYAHYLKGLAAYSKNKGLMDRIFASNPAKRDMTNAREAYGDFAALLARYPTSQYAPDAQKRMLYLRDLIARSELWIADYYMRRHAYAAASNRARYVVETYSKSEAAADALAIIIEANYRLGLEESANDALRVLALNFPEYQAFDENGDLVLTDQIRNRDRSWTNMITFGLLDRPAVPPPIKLRQPEGTDPFDSAP
ncbi:MAG: outer membrane protein assembly factor BamD [Pseudomonadota bacterium]